MNAAMTDYVHKSIPILGAMGLEVLEAQDGRASARIPLEQNINHFGVIYAGSLFTVAEMLGGAIGFSSLTVEGCVPLVKSLEIKFLRPATTPVVASTSLSPAEVERVKAEAAANGKSDYELVCEITDDNDVVVASTVGQYQLRRM